MNGSVLVDTGPIVAYLSADEQHHLWAVDQFSHFAAPLLTCEAVLTEAAHLVRRCGFDLSHVMGLVETGAIAVQFSIGAEVTVLRRLLQQYRDRPMDLADACLVRMSELYPSSQILTLDTDFHIYRRHGRDIIPVVMPDYGA